MKQPIITVILLFFVLVANAANTIVKNTNVTTSAGVLNVSVEQYANGIYDLLVSEPTKHASNVYMTEFPFKENREAFDEACKEAYITLFKSVYPELCSQIMSGTIREISLSVNFDDRKEFINKNFWVNVKSMDLSAIESAITELTGDDKLFNFIKNGSEEVYGKVSMTPRSTLSDEMLQLVNSGEKGYFSNAYLKITKEDLE
ncbi:MAG: hypothetical protein IKW43_08100 [Bacteroidaceae bacterium]|nr:hypothetical protein [Bacteroidaceae bacterium]